MAHRCPKCQSPYVTHRVDTSMGLSGDYYGYYEHKEYYQCRECGHIEPVLPPDEQQEEHHDRP